MRGARVHHRLAPAFPPLLLRERTMLLVVVLQTTGVAFAVAGVRAYLGPRK